MSTPQFAFEQETYPAIQLQDGEATLQVKATSTNSKGAVTYSVSPEGATIDGEGNFTATKAGTYTVTAQLAQDDEGGFAAAEIKTEIEVKAEPVEGMTILFEETFDGCDGTTGNFSGPVASKAFTDDMADNSGWTLTKGNAAYQAIKLGTGSAKGSAVSPNFTLNGDAVLKFTAAAWAGTSEVTTLKVSISSGTLSQSEVTLTKGEYKDFELDITGATAPVKITFEAAETKNNRFFLDYVCVYQQQSAETVLRDGLHEGMAGTLCVDRTIGANETKGAAFYTVAGVCYRGEEPAALVLEEAETLEAGRGYVFIAGGEKITTTNADEATATTGTNDGVIYGSLEGCYVPEGCYVINQNTVKKSNGRSHIQAGRAYIDVAAAPRLTADEAAAQRYRVLGFDGSLTGIGAIVAAGTEAPAYDLAGRRARMDRKGIYVKDGKKVIVK